MTRRHRHQWVMRGEACRWTFDLGVGEWFYGVRVECFGCGTPKRNAQTPLGLVG